MKSISQIAKAISKSFANDHKEKLNRLFLVWDIGQNIDDTEDDSLTAIRNELRDEQGLSVTTKKSDKKLTDAQQKAHEVALASYKAFNSSWSQDWKLIVKFAYEFAFNAKEWKAFVGDCEKYGTISMREITTVLKYCEAKSDKFYTLGRSEAWEIVLGELKVCKGLSGSLWREYVKLINNKSMPIGKGLDAVLDKLGKTTNKKSTNRKTASESKKESTQDARVKEAVNNATSASNKEISKLKARIAELENINAELKASLASFAKAKLLKVNGKVTA